ncbi:hypothetical protein VTN02DRAFT_529 [Thermoascus thermophilus]
MVGPQTCKGQELRSHVRKQGWCQHGWNQEHVDEPGDTHGDENVEREPQTGASARPSNAASDRPRSP